MARRDIHWIRSWKRRENRGETWADVNRLKRECGSFSVDGWNRACDVRDGKGHGRGTCDTCRNGQEEFTPLFIDELSRNDYDTRNLARQGGQNIDFE